MDVRVAREIFPARLTRASAAEPLDASDPPAAGAEAATLIAQFLWSDSQIRELLRCCSLSDKIEILHWSSRSQHPSLKLRLVLLLELISECRVADPPSDRVEGEIVASINAFAKCVLCLEDDMAYICLPLRSLLREYLNAHASHLPLTILKALDAASKYADQRCELLQHQATSLLAATLIPPLQVLPSVCSDLQGTFDEEIFGDARQFCTEIQQFLHPKPNGRASGNKRRRSTTEPDHKVSLTLTQWFSRLVHDPITWLFTQEEISSPTHLSRSSFLTELALVIRCFMNRVSAENNCLSSVAILYHSVIAQNVDLLIAKSKMSDNEHQHIDWHERLKPLLDLLILTYQDGFLMQETNPSSASAWLRSLIDLMGGIFAFSVCYPKPEHNGRDHLLSACASDIMLFWDNQVSIMSQEWAYNLLTSSVSILACILSTSTECSQFCSNILLVRFCVAENCVFSCNQAIPPESGHLFFISRLFTSSLQRLANQHLPSLEMVSLLQPIAQFDKNFYCALTAGALLRFFGLQLFCSSESSDDEFRPGMTNFRPLCAIVHRISTTPGHMQIILRHIWVVFEESACDNLFITSFSIHHAPVALFSGLCYAWLLQVDEAAVELNTCVQLYGVHWILHIVHGLLFWSFVQNSDYNRVLSLVEGLAKISLDKLPYIMRFFEIVKQTLSRPASTKPQLPRPGPDWLIESLRSAEAVADIVQFLHESCLKLGFSSFYADVVRAVTEGWHRTHRPSLMHLIRGLNTLALHHPLTLPDLIFKYEANGVCVKSETCRQTTTLDKEKLFLFANIPTYGYPPPFGHVRPHMLGNLSVLRLETLLSIEREGFIGIPNLVARTEMIIHTLVHSSSLKLSLDAECPSPSLSIHVCTDESLLQVVIRHRFLILEPAIAMALKHHLHALTAKMNSHANLSNNRLEGLQPLTIHLSHIFVCCSLFNCTESASTAAQMLQQVFDPSITITLCELLCTSGYMYDVVSCVLTWILNACSKLLEQTKQHISPILLISASMAVLNPRHSSDIAIAVQKVVAVLKRDTMSLAYSHSTHWHCSSLPDPTSTNIEFDLVRWDEGGTMLHKLRYSVAHASVRKELSVKLLDSAPASPSVAQRVAWISVAGLVLPSMDMFMDIVIGSASSMPVFSDSHWNEDVNVFVNSLIALYESITETHTMRHHFCNLLCRVADLELTSLSTTPVMRAALSSIASLPSPQHAPECLWVLQAICTTVNKTSSTTEETKAIGCMLELLHSLPLTCVVGLQPQPHKATTGLPVEPNVVKWLATLLKLIDSTLKLCANDISYQYQAQNLGWRALLLAYDRMAKALNSEEQTELAKNCVPTASELQQCMCLIELVLHPTSSEFPSLGSLLQLHQTFKSMSSRTKHRLLSQFCHPSPTVVHELLDPSTVARVRGWSAELQPKPYNELHLSPHTLTALASQLQPCEDLGALRLTPNEAHETPPREMRQLHISPSEHFPAKVDVDTKTPQKMLEKEFTSDDTGLDQYIDADTVAPHVEQWRLPAGSFGSTESFFSF